MIVTRNMLVSTAISHLARYSSLASSSGGSEDDDDDDGADEELRLCDISHERDAPLARDSLDPPLRHSDDTRSESRRREREKKKKRDGEEEKQDSKEKQDSCVCTRGSAPTTSVRRETRAAVEYSYGFPVAVP